MSEAAKWYVVHTYSGYENKVAQTIMRVAENRKLTDLVQDVRIPTEKEIVRTENGQEKEVETKMFPGYVLVKMILNDDSWYVVRNTRGVTGFVGPGGKADPLSDEEVARFGVDTGEARVVVNIKEGDDVRITSGAMEGFVGTVKAVDAESGTVDVVVSMFGRETPATIEIGQVTKVAD
ncbi:MAG: transcription termination/antitermination factor NusG [Oscillospiraceae bacterium]|nr:transcription termination/antitermination factor NusG [Oscillospiraceae bacterium]